MSWNSDTQMLRQAQDNTYTCACGHRLKITNRYGREICNWCGRMVYANKEDEKREKFKEKVREKLNGKNIYELK